MPADSVFSFAADEGVENVKSLIESRVREGDIILYKASRGIGLERVLP